MRKNIGNLWIAKDRKQQDREKWIGNIIRILKGSVNKKKNTYLVKPEKMEGLKKKWIGIVS